MQGRIETLNKSKRKIFEFVRTHEVVNPKSGRDRRMFEFTGQKEDSAMNHCLETIFSEFTKAIQDGLRHMKELSGITE